MARDAQLTAKVKVDGADRAQDQLDDLARSAQDLEEPIELSVDARIDAAVGAMRDLVQEATKAEQAAQALGQAMGSELAGKADLGKIVVGFEKAGLSLDEITEKADRLGRELADVAGEGGANLELVGKRARATSDDAAEGLENMRRKGEGIQSALPALRGFTDEMGGAAQQAGVAGQAIGDLGDLALIMGEQFGISEKAMAGIGTALGAVGIAAVAIGAVASVLNSQGAAAKASAERTKEWSKVVADASDDAQGLADSLRENQDQLRKFDAAATGFGGGIVEGLAEIGKGLPLLGGLIGDSGQSITDLVPIMKAAGVSIYDFTQALEDGGRVGAPFEKAIRDAASAGKISEDQYAAMSDALREYSKNVSDARDAQSLYNVDVAEAQSLLEGMADPLSRMGNEWSTLMQDMANGNIATQGAADAINALAAGLGLTQEEVINLAKGQLDKNMEAAAQATEQATKAAQEYAQVLGSSDWGASTVSAAAEAWQSLADTQFGLTNIAASQQAAYDDLNQAIADNGLTFDVATEKGRANADVIQQLYSSLIPSLSAAFADAGGNVDTFAANMDALRSNVFAQLDSQTSLTADQINAVIDQLGVFDGSKYASQFEVLGLADANAKLALLSGVLSSLPPDVQRQVTLDVIAGDPQAALDHIQAAVAPGATAPLHADPAPAEATAEGFLGDYSDSSATATLDANATPAEQTASGWASDVRATTATANLDANLNAAARQLAAFKVLAALLSPIVTVFANPNPAEQTINAVARPRVSNVYVDVPNAAAADRAIDAIASQPRTARIDVSVVPTSVLVRVNGGG